MAQEALDKRIAFRLPEKVAEAWKAAAKASRLSLSDWVRMQVGTDKAPAVKMGKPTPAKMPKRRPAPEANPRLIREVAALGNNLNQISRWLKLSPTTQLFAQMSNNRQAAPADAGRAGLGGRVHQTVVWWNCLS